MRTALANPPERGARRSLHARLRMAFEAARAARSVTNAAQSLAQRIASAR